MALFAFIVEPALHRAYRASRVYRAPLYAMLFRCGCLYSQPTVHPTPHPPTSVPFSPLPLQYTMVLSLALGLLLPAVAVLGQTETDIDPRDDPRNRERICFPLS